MAPKSLYFDVRRCKPELIRPAKPTPYEFKKLSDIDGQEALRIHLQVIQFYKSMQGIRVDPVHVIREGIARALVYYYPLAGRLREVEERKLVVECTGEGVMFIEADADVTLEQFGVLYPPYPCLEELLFDVPSSSGILDSPLMLIQVTRLKCGSFIFAIRFNHTMVDALGVVHFLKAVGEMARGATAPSTLPVWERHLLNARVPPQVTCNHREYEEQVTESASTIITPSSFDDMVQRSFFFGPTEISALRNCIPQELSSFSTFEVLTACLWRCRTLAVGLKPDEEVRMVFTVDARSKFNPPLPNGYYGNAFALTAAATTAGKLCSNPLGFALELIHKAKAQVTEEYMHSLADLFAIKGKAIPNLVRSYFVSDGIRARFDEVDFGWGGAVCSGPAVGTILNISSFYIPFRNRQGEQGILLPISLSPAAMETFVDVLDEMLNRKETDAPAQPFIKSPL